MNDDVSLLFMFFFRFCDAHMKVRFQNWKLVCIGATTISSLWELRTSMHESLPSANSVEFSNTIPFTKWGRMRKWTRFLSCGFVEWDYFLFAGQLIALHRVEEYPSNPISVVAWNNEYLLNKWNWNQNGFLIRRESLLWDSDESLRDQRNANDLPTAIQCTTKMSAIIFREWFPPRFKSMTISFNADTCPIHTFNLTTDTPATRGAKKMLCKSNMLFLPASVIVVIQSNGLYLFIRSPIRSFNRRRCVLFCFFRLVRRYASE